MVKRLQAVISSSFKYSKMSDSFSLLSILSRTMLFGEFRLFVCSVTETESAESFNFQKVMCLGFPVCLYKQGHVFNFLPI